MKLKQIAVAVASVVLMNYAYAADEQAATRPGKFRLPVISKPADVQALSHLNAEEKAMALENLKMVPPTDGWWVLGNDPELQALWQMEERINTSLLYPDMQVVPGSPMNLITLIIARRSGNEYLQGILASYSVSAIQSFGKDDDALTRLNMLNHPDSDIWTVEQRICIKFTNAVVDNTMTDQLFNQAKGIWGEKKLLRHLSWITFVEGWAKILNTMDFKYEASMRPPKGIMGPKAVEAITTKMKNTKTEMWKFWRTLPKFIE